MIHFHPSCILQVEIGKGYTSNEWREDLKAILRKTAEGDMNGVFLFTDTQVKKVNTFSVCFLFYAHAFSASRDNRVSYE